MADTQTQATLALITTVSLALLEGGIERRGLQEAYVRELCPWYHSFGGASIAELWGLLRVPQAGRITAALKVLNG